MKKNKQEEFPFAYLSGVDFGEETIEAESPTKRVDTHVPRRTLSGQIQILSLIALALFAVFLILLILTIWAFDKRQEERIYSDETSQILSVVVYEE